MGYTCFEIEIDAKVCHLRLNRPEQRNSMNRAFWSELPAAIEELEAAGGARAIVISSTGPHFSSGMDLSVFQAGDALSTASPVDRESFRRLVLALQDVFNRLERCRLPVIAAVQGGCIGGAVDMVSACDMRYATADAFFSIEEINIGIMADLGTLQRLPKLLPEGIVRELAYTGERLPAQRAQALGFVNEVFETQEAMIEQVLKIAGAIAVRAPLAVAASKEAITFVRDHSVGDALERAAGWQSAIFDQQGLLEAIRARKEQRPPVFADLRSTRVGV